MTKNTNSSPKTMWCGTQKGPAVTDKAVSWLLLPIQSTACTEWAGGKQVAAKAGPKNMVRGRAGIDGAELGSSVDGFLSDRPMRVGVFEVHQEGGSAAGQLRLRRGG